MNLQSGIYYISLSVFFFIISDDYSFKIFCILIILFLTHFSILNYKNKIFLGDNGVYIFFIYFFFNYNKNLQYYFKATCRKYFNFAVVSFLDLLRLFLFRLRSNRNPFEGDRNHIHHILLKNIV